MRVTVFSVLISLALPLFAQSPKPLTLDDYLGLVIKHNIDIQQYRDRASRAYTSFLLEDSAFSPLLDFRSSQTISSSETDGTRLETNAFTNRLDLSKRFRSTQGTLHVQYGLNRYHDNVLSGSAVEDEDINSSLSINYSQPLLRDLIGLNTFQARVLRAELNQKQTYQRL